MTRERLGPWMKLYADVVDRKAHYTDRQFRVLIEVFVMGLRATDRGILPPRKALEAKLGKDEIAFLFDEGDLIEQDGDVAISGWNTYQSGVLSTDRVHRHREAKGAGGNGHDPSLKQDETVSVVSGNSSILFPSTSTSISSTTTTREEPTTSRAPAHEDGADAKADPADAYWQITGRWPNDKALNWIDDLTQQYGAMPVIRAIAQRHADDADTRTLLGRVTDGLKREARQLDMKERDIVRERIDARPVKRRLTQDEKDAAYVRTNQIVARLMAGATDEQIRQEFGGSL